MSPLNLFGPTRAAIEENARKPQRPVGRWMLMLLMMGVVTATAVVGRGLFGSEAVTGGDYSAVFLILLYVNLFLAITFGFLVIRHLSRLWLDRRRRLAGSQLRTRMATLFVALSLLPTLVITVLSVELLNKGVDSWFSDQVATALDHSLDVARAYYLESQRTVRHDAEDMVRNRAITSALILEGAEAVSAALEVERQARGLDEIAIFRHDGVRVAKAGDLPQETLPDLTSLTHGGVNSLLTTDDSGSLTRAYVRLGPDHFLSAGRWIDRQILAQMQTIETTYVDYNRLRDSHGLLRGSHTITLALITLLLVLAAGWSGFRIADSITDPITELVVGTRHVAEGDLSVNLPVTGDDELATLVSSFNAMTRRLAKNRTELQGANALLEDRQQFLSAIVSNISSGVISVDLQGDVALINPVAASLLELNPDDHIGRPFEEALPSALLGPLQKLLAAVDAQGAQDDDATAPGDAVNKTKLAAQAQFTRAGGDVTLLVRLTPLESARTGFIITFDDLTQVVSAQRSRAWSEVARRIAHEIKNPLTPIQLWAQRMRRRYLHRDFDGEPDWRVLDEGTESIIQQVDELKVLVDEFSTFARLPRPHLQQGDLNVTVREALQLHDAELRNVDLTTQLAEAMPAISLDPSQIKQALTNLIANAIAAADERAAKAREAGLEAQAHLAIHTFVADNGRWVGLQVADSGPGIPAEKRDQVFEPYFTTKKRGTGLGLAIVKKIVEDHNGHIRIKESRWGGALVEVSLPRAATPALESRDLSA
ncbi:sensor histidine kinase [Magnetofaba australis]|uniref:histidine kinase n=1 Tax=Magnetofaba australis IT-1 TaxID=1434232 RepID=A0A1Y2K8I2_9PROT|nr:ATP-binding protein [Magnetofaba australis]OSM07051.1 putative PAS/PAC sensor signal transduction histidine kinase [Magnetofaba australis IT-1]